MFDPVAFNLSVDKLSSLASINVKDAVKFFVDCYLSEDRDELLSYEEKRIKYRSHVVMLVIDAIENKKFKFDPIYKIDGSNYVNVDESGMLSYSLNLMIVEPKEIVAWGLLSKIPIPEIMKNNLLIVKHDDDVMQRPGNEKSTQELGGMDSVVNYIGAGEKSFSECTDSKYEDYTLEELVSGLNIKHISDGDLKSLDESIHYSAIRLYGALYAGILIGRHSKSLNKLALESCLGKIGFKGCDAVTDKDFKAIWAAIPKTLKNQGAPRKAK